VKPSPRNRRNCIATLAILVGCSLPISAHAEDPTKRECVEANALAQTQRNEGKFRAAQASLRLCTSAACPAAVRDDCAQLLDDLGRKLPSMVFEAHDGTGADVTAVRVRIDGQPLAERLDGTAIAVDPGEHTFTFDSSGRATVTSKLVIREGDRGRRERITFAAAAPPPIVPAVVSRPPTSPTDTDSPPKDESPLDAAPSRTTTSTLRYVGYVAGGLGIVGLGFGAIFGLRASSKLSDSKKDPDGTGCDSQDFCGDAGKQARGDAQSAATLSTVGFVAGGALLAAGIALVVFGRSSTSTTATLAPMVGINSGGAFLHGRF